DFAVHDRPLVRADSRPRTARHVHRIPNPTQLDDPEAPLGWTGTEREHMLICRTWQGLAYGNVYGTLWLKSENT
ncbi:hypothetical protein ACQR14_36150, partial [Bradyrhizobium oligotrophicum]|uniref:hypothetical protein n=1 Tax=Bradyrhizobium oligotrophicum TaxID=44255 RepID=UPI003EBC5AE0